MKKIKILYIIASSNIGGAESFVYTLLRYMDDSIYEKYVVCPDGGPYVNLYRSKATDILCIDPKRSFMNIKVIKQVMRFIKDKDIDLVHTMQYTSDVCGIIAGMFCRGVRVLNTINGFYFLVIKKRSLRLRRRMASLVYRGVYLFSDKVVCVCEALRRDLLKRTGVKAPVSKLKTVLAAGVDRYYNFTKSDVDYLQDLGLSKDHTNIVSIGSLEEIKGHDVLLKAFKLVSEKDGNARLFIAGDGPLRKRYERTSKDLGLDKSIKFLGSLEPSKKNALLANADIFVMSSVSEGCPTALIEAMYFGRPVVASHVGGIPEMIENGVSGYLVKDRTPVGFFDAIMNVINDRKVNRKMGERARKIFWSRFATEKMLDAYEKLYKEVLPEKNKYI